MEELLLFLASSISSGAIGHYISKGLNKIDSELPLLLQNETDLDKIQKIIESKNIEEEVKAFAEQARMEFNNNNTGNVVNFTGGINQGVVANKVEFKSTKKQIRIEAPQGTIASSLLHRNYSKYLIDRYHEFKKAEVGNKKMNYVIFYGAIKREFGAKWDMLPLARFEELASYIQGRIDKTILGKNNKAQQKKSYSIFEEYVAKHGG
jgi:hypothetical protein